MTWYTVGLWPGAGVGLQMCTVEAFSEYEAFGEAVIRGCGLTISSEDYEEMVEDEIRSGYTREEAENIVSESYVWLDPPRAYVLFDNATIREASPVEMFAVNNGLHIEYSGNRFSPDASMYDDEGNALIKCMDCWRVAVENMGKCPFCGSDKVVELNVARPDVMRDLELFDPDNEASYGYPDWSERPLKKKFANYNRKGQTVKRR